MSTLKIENDLLVSDNKMIVIHFIRCNKQKQNKTNVVHANILINTHPQLPQRLPSEVNLPTLDITKFSFIGQSWNQEPQ